MRHHQALSWTQVTPFLVQAKQATHCSCIPEQWPILFVFQAGPEAGISHCRSGSFACVQAAFSNIWPYVFVHRRKLLTCKHSLGPISHSISFWRRNPEIYTKLLSAGKNDQQTLGVRHCVLLYRVLRCPLFLCCLWCSSHSDVLYYLSLSPQPEQKAGSYFIFAACLCLSPLQNWLSVLCLACAPAAFLEARLSNLLEYLAPVRKSIFLTSLWWERKPELCVGRQLTKLEED